LERLSRNARAANLMRLRLPTAISKIVTHANYQFKRHGGKLSSHDSHLSLWKWFRYYRTPLRKLKRECPPAPDSAHRWNDLPKPRGTSAIGIRAAMVEANKPKLTGICRSRRKPMFGGRGTRKGVERGGTQQKKSSSAFGSVKVNCDSFHAEDVRSGTL